MVPSVGTCHSALWDASSALWPLSFVPQKGVGHFYVWHWGEKADGLFQTGDSGLGEIPRIMEGVTDCAEHVLLLLLLGPHKKQADVKNVWLIFPSFEAC